MSFLALTYGLSLAHVPALALATVASSVKIKFSEVLWGSHTYGEVCAIHPTSVPGYGGFSPAVPATLKLSFPLLGSEAEPTETL